MKLMVTLPGIGYTCDRPILYYAGRLAASMGYEVIRVGYSGFPMNLRGNAEGMRACLDSAEAQAGEALKAVDWHLYDDIVFTGKSIGTVVACRLAKRVGSRARCVLLTPLPQTFDTHLPEAVAFHGTADPWADTPTIRAACADKHVPLYITENANHSLETGDALKDIENLSSVMRTVRDFLSKGNIWQ